MNSFENYNPVEKRNKLDFSVREAKLSDVREIVELRNAQEPINIKRYLERTTEEVELSLNKDNLVFMVAEHEKEIIAYARLRYWERDEERGKHKDLEGWFLNGIIVKDSYRRSGVGERLTKERVDHLKKIEASEVFYVVNSKNTVSIALHEKLGFEIIDNDFMAPRHEFKGGSKGLLCRMKLI